MVTATEAAKNAKGQLAAELAAGLEWLDLNQTISFDLYQRYVFAADGFIYWLRYDIVTPPITTQPTTVTINGSFHYSTEVEQEEASVVAVNTIVFTAESQVDSFANIGPNFLYIATYNGMQFAFGSQGKFYQQANLWHYVGVAVKSTKQTQLITDPTQLASINLVVSNSLPIWLGMPTYNPPYPGFICPINNIFPSFLIPDNEPPPYASIHIEDTVSLETSALLGSRLESSQLTSETVRVTTYGVDNDDIITFLNFVIQYSFDWNYIGILNMPIIKDVKEKQSELFTIAQKKEIEFKISYLQKSARDIARQKILSCIVYGQANYPNGPSSPQAGIVVKPKL